ncbi:MAG: DUF4124 domain-containing protein [bacterium]|nr:DUF4124 domain-containing protein [bacterium]
MRKLLIVLLVACLPGIGLVTTAAAGSIYQCEENGRKVFSQQPCGADAKVVKTDTPERTVALTASISSADVGYLCSLSMRAWEKQSEERRNAGGSYYNSYSNYRSGAANPEERRRAFVLSHIENLEKIAADDPELYEIAKSISGRGFSGDPGSYLYDAERAKARKDCVNDVNASIGRMTQRHKEEDKRRFGIKK